MTVEERARTVAQKRSWAVPSVTAATVLAVLALVAAGCSSSPTAAGPTAGKTPTTPATAHPAVVTGTATCARVKTVEVECTLPGSADMITLSTLVATATQYNATVSKTTPMVITAYGGTGAAWVAKAEPGGEAETTTTVKAYEATYQTSDLYYFLGQNGSARVGSHVEGSTGGASTLVASGNLGETLACIGTSTTTCNGANVLLVAAGAGGGGADSFYDCNNGHGGSGGTAIAITSANVEGTGDAGAGAGCTGGAGGGAGGGGGSGGSGGSGGPCATHKAGGGGQGGIGGKGGDVHEGSGPAGDVVWTTPGALDPIGTSGQGGEGEWRGTGKYRGGGGGGGGGYGGGGGGGGGGTDCEGAGGGGGGSFALQATTTAPMTPTLGPPMASTPTPNSTTYVTRTTENYVSEVVLTFVA